MTAQEYIMTLDKWEIARLEAVAIRNVACGYCNSKAGFPCRVNVRNEIGSFLPGFAHIARQFAWVEMADVLSESPLPAITDPHDDIIITALYGRDPNHPGPLDDILGITPDDISDLL